MTRGDRPRLQSMVDVYSEGEGGQTSLRVLFVEISFAPPFGTSNLIFTSLLAFFDFFFCCEEGTVSNTGSVITLRHVRRVRRVQRCNRFCNRAQGAHFCDAFDAFDAFDDATGSATGHRVHNSATRSTCSTSLIFQNHTNAELLVLVTPLQPLHHVPKPHKGRKCVCVCVCVCVCANVALEVCIPV